MSEFDFEYAPGLPEPLPEGERVIWQGRPQWLSLAVHAYHVRSIAIYFAILMAWRGQIAVSEGGSAVSAATAVFWIALLASAAIAVLAILAYFSARTTVYTITSRRVVMRFGIALPMTLNIPFRIVEAAALSVHRDGSGDIPLKLTGKDRVAFAVLWPHARPWRMNRPEPMLRAIPNPRQVAQMLSRAMVAESGQAAQPMPECVPASSATARGPLTAAAR